jgi:hypothetical protein
VGISFMKHEDVIMTKQKKLVHFENTDEKSESKPAHKKEKHHTKFFAEVTVNVTQAQEQKKDDGCTTCCLSSMNLFKRS